MRLLRTKGCQLIEANDVPTPCPEYAILSHTWISPKDEITYQDFKQRKGDIENGIFKQKGWAKVRQFCDRAVRDGWEWAWMDTCCIDKTNPADTQEAINAMFRWYQNAGICYAYLDDVDTGKVDGCPDSDLDNLAGRDNIANPESHTHVILSGYLSCAKWFKRGWTLQELLAPPYLVFVDQAWRRIGTREGWAKEIEKASRIEARHLTNFSPTDYQSCSIAMRLAWASRRETTVEEDETYSLLGLFGISLPLIYGEGRLRAFNRLQRELITVYNDDTIFAWKLRHLTNGHSNRSQEEDSKHGSGILAPSIKEYWESSKIESFGFYDSSFSMTNKGLEIKAERWRRKDDPSRCLIRLNCGLGGSSNFSNPLMIPLKYVDGTYDRVELDKLYDKSEITSGEWEQELSKEPALIRASNYSHVLVPPSIFALEYPEQVEVGKKYFVDFPKSGIGTELQPLDEGYSQKGFPKDTLVIESKQLVFINIELRSGVDRTQFDVIINLSERGSPSIGILPRGKEQWARLGDPLDEAVAATYESLADHLHRKMATNDPAYPAIAANEREDTVVGVCLLPRPRQTISSIADRVNLAKSREYLLKITVQEDEDSDRHVPTRSSKRRKHG